MTSDAPHLGYLKQEKYIFMNFIEISPQLPLQADNQHRVGAGNDKQNSPSQPSESHFHKQEIKSPSAQQSSSVPPL